MGNYDRLVSKSEYFLTFLYIYNNKNIHFSNLKYVNINKGRVKSFQIKNYKIMERKKNYFDEQETKCSKLLKHFNDDQNWFVGLTANTRGNEIDFKATDKKGRLVHIEHKQRKGTIEDFKKYGNILIEPSKINAFTKIMESGFSNNEQTLYLNYTDDGIIIFDLNNISEMIFYPNHRQINYGKHTVEHEHRFGLKIKDAIIYKKNNDNYIRLKQWD